MNSIDRDNIKLILSVEQNKKKVQIGCKDKAEGKTIAEAISNNTSELMSDGYDDFRKGLTYKNFTYKFGSKEEAKYFKDKIDKVKNSPSSPAPSSPDGSDVPVETSNNIVIIIAAVMTVVVIGLFVWMKSK